MKKNILAIGAHPDDVELGCAGTLLKHMELGDNVYVLVMTFGQQGNHPQSMRECKAAMKKLGIKPANVIYGGFADGEITDSVSTVGYIENLIKKLKINRVYTHAPQDRHQDHRSLSLAVSSAARRIPDVFLFEGPSTNSTFEPHYIVEISSEHLKKKLASLRSYKTQIVKGSFNMDFVEHLAGMNGSRFHAKYAEAYSLNHSIKRGDDV